MRCTFRGGGGGAEGGGKSALVGRAQLGEALKGLRSGGCAAARGGGGGCGGGGGGQVAEVGEDEGEEGGCNGLSEAVVVAELGRKVDGVVSLADMDIRLPPVANVNGENQNNGIVVHGHNGHLTVRRRAIQWSGRGKMRL
jgi:hypothetical protein